MVSVDRPVVRMFVCELDTVRWETRIADGRGLELKVFGPGALRRSFAFAMRCLWLTIRSKRATATLERVRITALSERRAGYDGGGAHER